MPGIFNSTKMVSHNKINNAWRKYSEKSRMKKEDFKLAIQCLIKPDEFPKPIKILTKTVFENAAKIFEITDVEIKSKCRIQHLVKCRMFISFYLKDHGLTLARIGKLLNRDHTSIMHQLKTFNDEIKYDEQFKQDYEYFKIVNQ